MSRSLPIKVLEMPRLFRKSPPISDLQRETLRFTLSFAKLELRDDGCLVVKRDQYNRFQPGFQGVYRDWMARVEASVVGIPPNAEDGQTAEDLAMTFGAAEIVFNQNIYYVCPSFVDTSDLDTIEEGSTVVVFFTIPITQHLPLPFKLPWADE